MGQRLIILVGTLPSLWLYLPPTTVTTATSCSAMSRPWSIAAPPVRFLLACSYFWQIALTFVIKFFIEASLSVTLGNLTTFVIKIYKTNAANLLLSNWWHGNTFCEKQYTLLIRTSPLYCHFEQNSSMFLLWYIKKSPKSTTQSRRLVLVPTRALLTRRAWKHNWRHRQQQHVWGHGSAVVAPLLPGCGQHSTQCWSGFNWFLT